MRKIAIAALGGTIASKSALNGGDVPAFSIENLLLDQSNVLNEPQLPSLRYELANLAQLSSASLSFELLFAVLDWAEQAVLNGAAAVIITQGTDTLEETAFFLHLYWRHDEPLIVTGAMRSPLMLSADGPFNLSSSIRVACADESRKCGVLVVLNGDIHSAYWLRKTDSLALNAFQSPHKGVLGQCIEGKVIYYNAQRYGGNVLPRPSQHEHRVGLYLASFSDDTAQLEWLLSSGLYHGLVIAGYGSGHLSMQQAECVKSYASEVPIIMGSRCYSGPTTRVTYGYIGSEIDLAAAGVHMAGFLTPLKARLLLWALLGSDKKLDIGAEWREGWALA